MADDVKRQSLDPSSARRFRKSAIRAAEQSRDIDTTPAGGYGAIAGILAPAAAAVRAIPAMASGVRSWAGANDLVRQLMANEAAANAAAAGLGFGSTAAALTQAAPKVGGALSGAAALSPAIQSLPSTNKPNNAPGGFVPEAPGYYFNAGKRFDNPTQAFMAEAAAERQMIEALSGHMAENQAAQQARAEAAARQADEDARAIQSGTPRGASLLGLNAGEAKANEQNQRGFLSTLLGNVDWKGLLSVMARPEFLEPGVSPAVAFSKAAFGQRQAEAGAAATRQKQMVELQKEMIKKSAETPKVTDTTVKLAETFNSSSQGLDTVQQLLKLFTTAQTGGFAGTFDALGNDFLTLIGLDPGASNKEKATALVSRLKFGLGFGGPNLSDSDKKWINDILKNPGIFTANQEIAEKLGQIRDELNAKRTTAARLLEMGGYNPSALFSPSAPTMFKSSREG